MNAARLLSAAPSMPAAGGATMLPDVTRAAAPGGAVVPAAPQVVATRPARTLPCAPSTTATAAPAPTATHRRVCRHATPARRAAHVGTALLGAALLGAALLGGCASLAPPQRTPAVDLGPAFKEADGVPGWVPAAPAELVARGAWWQVLGEPQIDALLPQVEAANPGVAVALARRDAAEAATAGQAAVRWPQAQVSVGATRADNGIGAPATVLRANAGVSWEADLWGRLRDNERAARADAQARAADAAAALLAAQAGLARSVIGAQAAAAEGALLQAAIDGYARSLQIARNRYDAGQVARTDVLQAESQWASAQADAAAVDLTRRQNEHAAAIWLGRPPAALTLPATAPWRPTVPALPALLPSELLQRRPDIAAAERSVAAANARIGIARTAWFPSLGLSASAGTQATRVADLFDAPGLLWSLGVSLAQTVFDAGARSAAEREASAAHAAATATYRQTVLAALQEVEDLLAQRRSLALQADLRLRAAEAATLSEQQVLNRYRAGRISFTEVVQAQATALGARRARVQVQAAQQLNTVALIQALGGTWTAQPAGTPAAGAVPPEGSAAGAPARADAASPAASAPR